MEGGDRLRSHLASLRCADCGRAYGDGHVRIRAEREAVSFVDLVCRACGRQASAVATLDVDGSAPARIELGDLDEASASAEEVHDVVEMGHFLAAFDGDFRRHIAEGGSGQGGLIDGSSGA
jgi:hypothetical protein